MKKNFFECNHICRIPYLLFLLAIIFSSNRYVYGQSTIYKSDGTTIQVFQIEKRGDSRSYRLSNDSTEQIYYISWKAIDSIRYENGTVERFYSEVLLPQVETPVKKARKNFLGVNIWPFFYKDIEFFYERLITEHIGIKNNVLVRLSESYPYDDYYREINYSINSGANYYFLESDLFRFGTGVAFNIGQFEKEQYNVDPYYEYDPYTDSYYPYYSYSTEKKMYSTVFINGSFTSKIQNKVFATIEIDIPLFNKPPYAFLFKTELAINF